MFAKIKARRNAKKAKKANNTSAGNGRTLDDKLKIFSTVLAGVGSLGSMASNFMPKKGNQLQLSGGNPVNNTGLSNGDWNKEDIEEWATKNVPFVDKVDDILENTNNTTKNTSNITEKLPLIGGIIAGVTVLIIAIVALTKRKRKSY